jgi:hypothetical protein
MKSWSLEVEYDETLLPDWWYETLESLAKSAPFGNGRVYLGLGFDDFKQPKQVVVDLWEKCGSLGVRLKTTHYVAPTMPSTPPHPLKNEKYSDTIDIDSVNLLSGYGLLDKNILFSHINGITKSDAQTLVKHGAFFSTTPDTELQMGLGEIVAFRPDVKCNASIGVDCHANNSGDLLTQLRIGFQHSRGTDNIKALQAGQYPSVQVKLEEVFNLGTIQGAKAVSMEDQIGSIAVGKLADLVIFNTTSPGMICAAEENPLAALLLHANVGDIEMVIVDGEIRKEKGQLTDVKMLKNLNGQAVEPITWGKVTEKLLKSRGHIKERGQGQDPEAGMQFLFRTIF